MLYSTGTVYSTYLQNRRNRSDIESGFVEQYTYQIEFEVLKPKSLHHQHQFLQINQKITENTVVKILTRHTIHFKVAHFSEWLFHVI